MLSLILQKPEDANGLKCQHQLPKTVLEHNGLTHSCGKYAEKQNFNLDQITAALT